MDHIFTADETIKEKEGEPMEDTSQKPSLLSYFGAIVGIASFVLSLGYIVFVAGAQANTIDRHEDEIRELRQAVSDKMVTKDDFRRLEGKVDQIIDRELQKR